MSKWLNRELSTNNIVLLFILFILITVVIVLAASLITGIVNEYFINPVVEKTRNFVGAEVKYKIEENNKHTIFYEYGGKDYSDEVPKSFYESVNIGEDISIDILTKTHKDGTVEYFIMTNN